MSSTLRLPFSYSYFRYFCSIFQSRLAPALLSERYNKAMLYAARLHRSQVRKYNHVPYIAHLQSVAALVLCNGGNEDEAIAAWLHDAVEDQGGFAILQDIRARFGDSVAEMVKGCSDSFTGPTPPLFQRIKHWWRIHRSKHSRFQTTKDFLRESAIGLRAAFLGTHLPFYEVRPSWQERKKAYIHYLKYEASPSVLLISACDKLDNIRSQLQEYREHQEEHWHNFSGGKKILQYFDAVLKAFEFRKFRTPVTEELTRVAQEFKALVEKTTGEPLPQTNIFDGI